MSERPAPHAEPPTQVADAAGLRGQLDEARARLTALEAQQQTFAYGVSHEMRAPLRAIDGFAGLLEAHPGAALDATAREYVRRIRGAAARMGGLIDALQELSRVARANLRRGPVDLSLLAEWADAELRDAAPGRVGETVVAPGLSATGDERLLKLLLAALLDNAWKFSGTAGPARIDIDGRREGDRLHLRIRDQGIGFDMRYADKLFEPFQRLHTDEEGGGDGLGLSIAQRIAERHGGRIRAESAPGAGATFHVELPAHDAAAQGDAS